jgi:hypothetical protein
MRPTSEAESCRVQESRRFVTEGRDLLDDDTPETALGLALERLDEGLTASTTALAEVSAAVAEGPLSNVDVQNVRQKESQLLQLLSNIVKMRNDALEAIIRKLSGS